MLDRLALALLWCVAIAFGAAAVFLSALAFVNDLLPRADP